MNDLFHKEKQKMNIILVYWSKVSQYNICILHSDHFRKLREKRLPISKFQQFTKYILEKIKFCVE